MPSLISRLATRLGFVSTRVASLQADQAARLAAARTMAVVGARQRNLLASLTTPDVASWQSDGVHINTQSSAGLAVVRARSRDAAWNNEHAIRFIGMVLANVLGPHGVQYQSRMKTAEGQPRKIDNDRLETGWKKFSTRGVFDVTGRYSLADADRLALRAVVVDGECFVRIRPGRGPHGLQVQLLLADSVPLTYSADLSGGRKVRQGVEFDADGRVLAWHVRQDDVTQDLVGPLSVSSQRLVRIPADEMWQLMLPQEIGQLRGVPWMHGALKRMYQASDFASAGLNKAREAAKRGGFIQPDKDAPGAGDTPQVVSGAADQAATEAAHYSTLHDGTWEKLLPGETALPFESDYPNIEYGQFIKDCVRGIAASLNVAYITLGNDLEAVNYSSGQLGLEGERDMWMGCQTWWVEGYRVPLHRVWLKYGLVAAPELQGLSYDRLEQYHAAARWQPHRWQPLDKLKAIEADRSGIEAFLDSPQRAIARRGEDPDEIVAEIREWQQKTADLRPMTFGGAKAPAAGSQDANADPAAARAALRLQLIQGA